MFSLVVIAPLLTIVNMVVNPILGYIPSMLGWAEAALPIAMIIMDVWLLAISCRKIELRQQESAEGVLDHLFLE